MGPKIGDKVWCLTSHTHDGPYGSVCRGKISVMTSPYFGSGWKSVDLECGIGSTNLGGWSVFETSIEARLALARTLRDRGVSQ